MKLSQIVNKIINEDTWGNNPSAAGAMSPGTPPNATSPKPSSTGRNLDIDNLFDAFKRELETQEKASVRKFTEQLKKNFLNKHIKIAASKGGIGQIEKEYSIDVTNIEVRYMKDKYYIVFTGKEGQKAASEYYLDDSVIEVDDAPQPVSSTGTTGGLSQPSMGTKRNILPQG